MTARPLSTRGGDLPPNLLLAAKLLTLVHFTQLLSAERFLPFLPPFDAVPQAAFSAVVLAALAAGMAGLFFTRRSRASCLLLGLLMLACELASKPFFSNGKTFWAYIMILLGLYCPEDGGVFLRWQFVVMYAACGLNKALDPDWWSGRYFDNWMRARVAHRLYLAAAPLLPDYWLARLLSWPVIGAELGAAACFSRARWTRAGVWLALGLHGGILLILWGETFSDFFFGVVISLLAFVDWPRRLRLAYPEGSRPLAALAALIRRTDWDRAWTFTRSEAGAPLVLEQDGAVYEGFAALKRALLYTPAFLYAAMLAGSRFEAPRAALVGAALALYLPPLEGFWDRLFGLDAPPRGAIVLYDGVCGFCDGFVRFVLARDRAGAFRFAPLQGAFARETLARRGFDAADLDTVYVVSQAGTPQEKVLRRSKAVLAVLAQLGLGWRLLSLLSFLPAFALDPFYDAFAAARYRLFGRYDACPLPDPKEKTRFVG